jgi:uncharacterized flavoprotein (TIGR03862 family)
VIIPSHDNPALAIIGGGPAGLMAAESASMSGVQVHLYDAMPSVGRKFLLTGKGGLNITHAEPFDRFKSRYRPLPAPLEAALDDFGPDAVRHWVGGFGIATIIGSSGRVFPQDFKAAPLLRAWQRRLREAGVLFHTRHRWLGWDSDDALRFDTPHGPVSVPAAAVVLALGGASWPQLGSNGAWVEALSRQGILISPLVPANCRFECGSFSQPFCERYAGTPVKNIRLHCEDDTHTPVGRAGELMVTANGIEGSPVYALSSLIRQQIDREGMARVWLDLCPDRSRERLAAALRQPRGSRSLSGFLQRKTGLQGIKSSLLRECLPSATLTDPEALARAIKALPLALTAPGALETAISTAGGVRFDQLDARLMLPGRPGVFVAGEMLDYDAPTGGYLLTACLATGRMAGQAATEWLMQQEAG